MLTEVISKITSESLLSLYPTIVKNIDIPFDLKLWTRFVPYSLISLLFIDYKFVKENLLSKAGLLLSFITILHIYTSYKGFEGLESGIAYTIFYTYPLMILLMAGEKLSPIMFIPLVGVGLLVYESNVENMESQNNSENLEEKDEETKEFPDNLLMFSLLMVFLAALTEALLYFVVRDLKTNNNWNHLFISYFFGAILISGSLLTKINEVSVNGLLTTSFILNTFIGLFGYFLRFYATTRLEPSLYAPLSYVGIIMSHIYGFLFNGNLITWKKAMGTLLIIVPNVYIKL
jgi:drug/metabolite transporter (DMT)-like permease